jgi:2-amino-4-hydroxy-6-hydroxymethyldihydropteridine diphosphokinase
MRAWIGLGANLGRPQEAIATAIDLLDRSEATRVVARAKLYGSQPVGPPGQPDYVNTAVEVETALAPHALLAALKSIERTLGRTPAVRWGPRIIDLDLLLYGDAKIETPDLVVPHAELGRRRFVLAPLADLCPELVVPGLDRSVRALLDVLADDPNSVWALDT